MLLTVFGDATVGFLFGLLWCFREEIAYKRGTQKSTGRLFRGFCKALVVLSAIISGIAGHSYFGPLPLRSAAGALCGFLAGPVVFGLFVCAAMFVLNSPKDPVIRRSY